MPANINLTEGAQPPVGPRMTSLQDFLGSLFPTLADGEFIELRVLASQQSPKIMFCSSVPDVVAQFRANVTLLMKAHTFFGVCPRTGHMGTKEAVKRVLALWADVDAKVPPFVGDKKKALAALLDFSLKPSVVVDSGNGYHGYWLLREPIHISGPESVNMVESHLKRLATAINGDPTVAEIARTMRLPGTFNVKDSENPLPVNVVEFEPGRLYDLADFVPHLPARSGAPERPYVTGNAPGWLMEAFKVLQKGEFRNATFSRLIGRLHRDRWQPDEIYKLLAPHAEGCDFPEAEFQEEIRRLCRRYPSGGKLNDQSVTDGRDVPFEAVKLGPFMESADEPIDWTVDRILPAGGSALLAAPPGVGKSWKIQDLAIEVARGGKWLGHFDTTQGTVLVVDEESMPQLLRFRMRKLLKAKGLSAESLDLHLLVNQGLCLTDAGSVAKFRDLMARIRPKLVIGDALVRLHRADENSATEMSQVFSVIKKMMVDFECAFLLVDHQRKQGGLSPEMMVRGSSDKVAFVDSVLSLRRENYGLVVEHSKSRYGMAVPSFLIEIKDQGEDCTTVAYIGEEGERREEARQEAARKFVLAVLAGGEWLSRKDLVTKSREAGIVEKAIDAVLKVMVETEKTVERENRKPENGRGGRAAYYRLGGQGGSPPPASESERAEYPTISSPRLPSKGAATETKSEGNDDPPAGGGHFEPPPCVPVAGSGGVGTPMGGAEGPPSISSSPPPPLGGETETKSRGTDSVGGVAAKAPPGEIRPTDSNAGALYRIEGGYEGVPGIPGLEKSAEQLGKWCEGISGISRRHRALITHWYLIRKADWTTRLCDDCAAKKPWDRILSALHLSRGKVEGT